MVPGIISNNQISKPTHELVYYTIKTIHDNHKTSKYTLTHICGQNLHQVFYIIAKVLKSNCEMRILFEIAHVLNGD